MTRGAAKCLDLFRWYAARFNEIYPYQQTVARRLGIKDRQLRTYILELKQAGFLTVSKQGRGPAVYQLVAEENCRSTAGLTAGRLPVEASASITEFKSDLEKTKQAGELEFPPMEIVHPAGGRQINPEWQHLQNVLRAAKGRIERADNPAAYERKIILWELAAIEGLRAAKTQRIVEDFANRGQRHGARRDAATGKDSPLHETPCPLLAESSGNGAQGEPATPQTIPWAMKQPLGSPFASGVQDVRVIPRLVNRGPGHGNETCIPLAEESRGETVSVESRRPTALSRRTLPPKKPPERDEGFTPGFFASIEALARKKTLARAP